MAARPASRSPSGISGASYTPSSANSAATASGSREIAPAWRYFRKISSCASVTTPLWTTGHHRRDRPGARTAGAPFQRVRRFVVGQQMLTGDFVQQVADLRRAGVEELPPGIDLVHPMLGEGTVQPGLQSH